MIKVTQRNIIDNGIKYKADGYCYLVTEENFDFWCQYTDNNKTLNVIKKHGRTGYIFFYKNGSITYEDLTKQINGMKYYEALGLECIQVISPALITCE